MVAIVDEDQDRMLMEFYHSACQHLTDPQRQQLQQVLKLYQYSQNVELLVKELFDFVLTTEESRQILSPLRRLIPPQHHNKFDRLLFKYDMNKWKKQSFTPEESPRQRRMRKKEINIDTPMTGRKGEMQLRSRGQSPLNMRRVTETPPTMRRTAETPLTVRKSVEWRTDEKNKVIIKDERKLLEIPMTSSRDTSPSDGRGVSPGRRSTKSTVSDSVIIMYKPAKTDPGFSISGGRGGGIYVSHVTPNSPADCAGLAPGDRLVEVNYVDFSQLTLVSAQKILRDSSRLRMVINQAEREPVRQEQGSEVMAPQRHTAITSWFDCRRDAIVQDNMEDHLSAQFSSGIPLLNGINERRINLTLGRNEEYLGFNIRGGREYGLGIYVSHVDHAGLAEQRGIRVGDRIVDVNGQSFEKISHEEAVHFFRSQRQLMLTVRGVGRFPVYKMFAADSEQDRASIQHSTSHPSLVLTQLPIETKVEVYTQTNDQNDVAIQTERLIKDHTFLVRDKKAKAPIKYSDLQDQFNEDNMMGYDEVTKDNTVNDDITNLDDPFPKENEQQILGRLDRAISMDFSDVDSDISSISQSRRGYNFATQQAMIDGQRYDRGRSRTPDRTGRNRVSSSSRERTITVSSGPGSERTPETSRKQEALMRNEAASTGYIGTPERQARRGYDSPDVGRRSKETSETARKGFSTQDQVRRTYLTPGNGNQSYGTHSVPKRADSSHELRSRHYGTPETIRRSFTSPQLHRRAAESEADNTSLPGREKIERMKQKYHESPKRRSASVERQTSRPEPKVEEKIEVLESFEFAMPNSSGSSTKSSVGKNIKDFLFSKKRATSYDDLPTEMARKGSIVRESLDRLKAHLKGGGKGDTEVSAPPRRRNSVDGIPLARATYVTTKLEMVSQLAAELLEKEGAKIVMGELNAYLANRDIERLVPVMLTVLDTPERLLLLRDIREFIAPTDLGRFDSMVLEHESQAYEQLYDIHNDLASALNKVGEDLPKKRTLMASIPDHRGKFHLRPQKEYEKQRQKRLQNLQKSLSDFQLRTLGKLRSESDTHQPSSSPSTAGFVVKQQTGSRSTAPKRSSREPVRALPREEKLVPERDGPDTATIVARKGILKTDMNAKASKTLLWDKHLHQRPFREDRTSGDGSEMSPETRIDKSKSKKTESLIQKLQERHDKEASAHLYGSFRTTGLNGQTDALAGVDVLNTNLINYNDNSDTESHKEEIIFSDDQSDFNTEYTSSETLAKQGRGDSDFRPPVLDMSKLRRGNRSRPELSQTETNIRSKQDVERAVGRDESDGRKIAKAVSSEDLTRKPRSPYDRRSTGVIMAKVPKAHKQLGLSITGGKDSRKHPHVSIQAVMADGAAAASQRIAVGMRILSIDGQSLKNATHQDAVNIIRKSYMDKNRPYMLVELQEGM